MRILYTVLLSALFPLISPLTAQTVSDKHGFDCGSAQMYQSLLEQDPAVRARHEQFENSILQNTAQRSAAPPYVLPVVVHIIHNNGPENISDAQVITAIDHLNQAFAAQAYYAQKGATVNSQIQFCLAKRAPDGSATTGITRNVSTLTSMTMETEDLMMKDLNRWDPLEYVNVWVVGSINSNASGSGVAGYAYLPGAHGAPFDGMVCEAQYFGNSPSNDGVLIHEMGHYLGLYHTFSGGCPNDNCQTDGDRVCDTPPDQGTHTACVYNSCSTDTDDLSANNPFASDVNDMTENFMDYSPFSCYYAFTNGQSQRMHDAIENIRYSLLTSKGCQDPCLIPIDAAFTASALNIPVGQSVNFTNNSTGATVYDWTIDGVSFASTVNTSYFFNTVGVYEIVLSVTNPDPNCGDTARVFINVSCSVVTDISANAPKIDLGQTITMTNNTTGASTYDWTVNGLSIASTPGFSFTPVSGGAYSICLNAENQYCASSECVVVIVRDTAAACNANTYMILYNSGFDERAFSIQPLPDGGALVAGDRGDEPYLMQIGPSGEAIWMKMYQLPGFAASNFVQTTLASDGNIYALGVDFPTPGSPESYIFKLTPDGTLIWVREFSAGLVAGYHGVNAMYATPDGGVALASTQNFNANQFSLVKFDANGILQFASCYDGPGNTDLVSDVKMLQDGGYIMSGYTNSGATGTYDAIGVRFNAAGTVVWQKRYATGQSEVFYSVDEEPNGDLIFSGNVSGNQAIAVKTDAQGNIIWSRWYQIPVVNNLSVRSHAVTTDGYVFAVEDRSQGVNPKFVYYKTDKNGEVQWVREYASSSLAVSRDVRALPTNELMLTGWTRNGASGLDVIVLKTDAEGFSGDCITPLGVESSFWQCSVTNTPFVAAPQDPFNNISTLGPTTFPVDTTHLCYDVCAEICDNGLDDDSDGYVDCYDIDCNCNPAPDCFVDQLDRPITARIDWQSAIDDACVASTPIVANLNPAVDSIPEIIVLSAETPVSLISPGFLIFSGNGANAATPGYQPVTGNIDMQPAVHPTVADVDENGVPEVILVSNDNKIRVYTNYNPANNPPMTEWAVSVDNAWSNNARAYVADFDGDGKAEIFAGNDIFKFDFTNPTAPTLTRVLDGTGDVGQFAWINYNQPASSSTAADFLSVNDCAGDPDCEGLELIAGRHIYSVDLDPFDGDPVEIKIQRDLAALDPTHTYADGYTVVADVDIDGDPDVLVNSSRDGAMGIAVWDKNGTVAWLPHPTTGLTNRVGGMVAIANVYPDASAGFTDDYPEIIATSSNFLHAYNLHAAQLTPAAPEWWNRAVEDVTGTTGAVTFDLNGDGLSEVIHRDEDSLRILYGGAAPFPAGVDAQRVWTSVVAGSTALDESAVVADVDHDGQAEIVVTGFTNPAGPTTPPWDYRGRLKVVETASLPWLPARAVWNQYNYFVTNIDDNLSVVKNQQQHWLEFAGPGGGKYPFNIHNAQIPWFDTAWNAYLPTADARLKLDSFRCETDMMHIWISICNFGDVPLADSTPIAVYLGNPLAGSLSPFGPLHYTSGALPVDSCRQVTFMIPAVYNTLLYVMANDDGSGPSPYTYADFPVTNIPECDYANNVDSFSIPFQNLSLDLGPDRELCSSSVIELVADSGYVSYRWHDFTTEQTFTAFGPGKYWVDAWDACGFIHTDTVLITLAPTPPIELGADRTICAGDSVSFSVSGYDQYQWSPETPLNCSTCADVTAAPSDTTTFFLTASTGACFVSDSVKILVVQAPALTLTAVDGSCSSVPSITATAGGNAPFEFIWSSTDTTAAITPAVSGTYTVSVTDAFGCVTADSAAVNVSGALLIDTVLTHPLCPGAATGAIDLTVLGGTTPYNFSWSNSNSLEDQSSLLAGVYTVTVSDAVGCTRILNIDLIGPPAFVLDFVSQNSACAGDSTGAIDLTVVQGGVGPYTFNWSNNKTTEDITSITSGLYIVTVTDVNGCSASDLASVNANGGPVLSAVVSQPACPGVSNGAIDLTIQGGTAPLGILWSNASTNEDLSGLGGGSFSVVVTDVNGCSGTYATTLTMPDPFEMIFSLQSIACNGDSTGAINLTPDGGTMPYTYQWSNGAATQDVSNIPAGSYMVTVTDANSCTTVRTVPVSQPPALQASFATVDPGCPGANTGSINVTASGGISPYEFDWSNMAVTEDLTGVGGGTWTVTITDDNGCSEVFSTTLNTPPAIVPDTIVTPVSCAGGANGAIDLMLSGGTPPFSYQWSNAAVTEDISGLGTGTYTVTITDGNTCTSTLSATLTAPPAFSATLTPTDASCAGGDDGFIDLTVSGASGTLSFKWSDGSQLEDPTGLNAGVYTVTITDAQGCTATDSVSISDAPLFELEADVTYISCPGDDGFIDLTVAGATPPYTVMWSNGAVTEDISVLEVDTFIVVVTDSKGCTASVSYPMYELGASPVLTPETDTLNCVQFDGSLYVGSDVQTLAYQWDGPGLTGTNAAYATIDAPGTYSVTVTAADNGCTSVATFEVPADTLRPTASIAADSILVPCQDTSAVISALGSSSGPEYDITWTVAGGGSILSGADGLEPAVSGSGIFTLSILNTRSGCVGTDAVAVFSPGTPIPDTIAVDSAQCFGEASGVITVGAINGGAAPYTYSVDGQNFSANPVLDGLLADVYLLTVRDAQGCEWQTDITIEEPNSFGVTLTGDLLVLSGEQALLEATLFPLNLSPVSISWSPEELFADPNRLEQTPQVIENTVFTITVTAENGCTQSAEWPVETYVQRNFYIPNAIYPDDPDGLNSKLLVFGGEGVVQVKRFYVFDRWGDLIFAADDIPVNDPDYGWDGYYKGKKVNPGVYVWYAQIEFSDGQVILYEGDVTVF